MKTNLRQFTVMVAAAFVLLSSATVASGAERGAAKSVAPSTPGNFHVTSATASSVTFAWTASNPGSGRGLVYEITNVTTGLIMNVGDVTTTNWTYGIEPSGTYSFDIIAVSGDEGSAPSPEVTVTIPGAPAIPPAVKPAPPVITQTSVTSDTITVSWTEATPADEIGSYQVLVNGMEDGGGNASTSKSTAINLWPGYSYSITVVAYSLNGTTGALTTASSPVTVSTAAATITPPANAPTAPTDLTGDGDGGGEAIISWTPSTSVNEAQSQIQYNPYIDGVLDSFDSSVGQTQDVYIFPRGAAATSQVWVVAVDQFGNQSAPSNFLTITNF
jgi:Fibronectin type III domain